MQGEDKNLPEIHILSAKNRHRSGDNADRRLPDRHTLMVGATWAYAAWDGRQPDGFDGVARACTEGDSPLLRAASAWAKGWAGRMSAAAAKEASDRRSATVCYGNQSRPSFTSSFFPDQAQANYVAGSPVRLLLVSYAASSAFCAPSLESLQDAL